MLPFGMLKDVSAGALGAGSGIAGAEAVSGNEAVGGKFATALNAVEELQNGEGTEADVLPGQEVAAADGGDVAAVTLAALPGFGAPLATDGAPLAGGDTAVEPDVLKPVAPGGRAIPLAGGQDGDAGVSAPAPKSSPGSLPQGAPGDIASQPGGNPPVADRQDGQDGPSPKATSPNLAGAMPTGNGVEASVAALPAGKGAQVPDAAGADIKPVPAEAAVLTRPTVPSNDNAGSPKAVSGDQARAVQSNHQVLPVEQAPATDRRWKTELPEVARSSLFKTASAAGKPVDASAALPSEFVSDDELAGAPVVRSALPSQPDRPDVPQVPKAPASGELPKLAQNGLPQADLRQDGASAPLPPSVAEQMESAELDLQISRPRPELAMANNATQPQGGAAGARADSTAAPQLTPVQLFGKPTANNAVQQQDADVPAPELSDADTLSTEPSAAKSSSPEGTTGPVAAGASSTNSNAAGNGGTPAAGAPAAAGVVAAALVAGEPAVVESDADPALMLDPKVSGLGSDVLKSVRQDALNMPTQAQSGQVATQVAAEISRNLQNGNTRFQMRFDPPELGRVEVNMRVAADGSVQAHLIVDRPETLDMFMRDQRGLERALEAAGLNTDPDNLKFTLKDQGGQNSQFSQEQRDEGTDGRASNSAGNDAEEETADEIVHLNIGSDRSGLDIRV